jgi:hypothetical protein
LIYQTDTANLNKMVKFKQEILNRIKSDPDLFASVAKAMGIKPTTLAANIDRNGNSLNQYSIVTLVASHLGMEPEDLLESESENTVKEHQS